MIRVYFLQVDRIDNTDTVRGIEYIHNAILECTEKPDVRKLTMDTTTDEDSALSTLAIEVREPTPEEIEVLAALPSPTRPTGDLAAEIDKIKARIGELEEKWE